MRVVAHGLASWESGSMVGVGAVDGVDGLRGSRREGGGGGGGTANNCATVFSIRSIRSSNVIRSCDKVEVRVVTVLRSVRSCCSRAEMRWTRRAVSLGTPSRGQIDESATLPDSISG